MICTLRFFDWLFTVKTYLFPSFISESTFHMPNFLTSLKAQPTQLRTIVTSLLPRPSRNKHGLWGSTMTTTSSCTIPYPGSLGCSLAAELGGCFELVLRDILLNASHSSYTFYNHRVLEFFSLKYCKVRYPLLENFSLQTMASLLWYTGTNRKSYVIQFNICNLKML